MSRRWLADDRTAIIAANLSARDLENPDFHGNVSSLLDFEGCRPELFEFEITETAIMNNRDAGYGALRSLKDLGVSLSIDDYGTGYSSLELLASMPFDTLKVDKAFVQGAMRDDRYHHVLRSTIDLGHKLGMSIIAEGVETGAMAHAVKAWGCHYGQGYLYGQPLPLTEFDKWWPTISASRTKTRTDPDRAADSSRQVPAPGALI